jgi:hypothetical protein
MQSIAVGEGGAKREQAGPMRMLALGIVAAVGFLALWFLYFLARPVIWKLWAELTHRPAAKAAVKAAASEAAKAAPAPARALLRHLLGA